MIKICKEVSKRDGKTWCYLYEHGPEKPHMFSVQTEHGYKSWKEEVNDTRSLASSEQPTPSGKGTPIYTLVCRDVKERAKVGEKKYGEVLKANNGRDPLVDAYQEAIDLVKYLRQALTEKYGEDLVSNS